MRSITFCEDARALFTLAEQMADVLAQKRPELGRDDRTEAHLRASIAGARYACTVYAAMCRDKEKSAVARRFLEQADHRRRRALKRLREHVIRSLRPRRCCRACAVCRRVMRQRHRKAAGRPSSGCVDAA